MSSSMSFFLITGFPFDVGTPVEAWSSPDALSKCASSTETATRVEGPQGNSVLWNAMIFPMLRLSLRGAIW